MTSCLLKEELQLFPTISQCSRRESYIFQETSSQGRFRGSFISLRVNTWLPLAHSKPCAHQPLISISHVLVRCKWFPEPKKEPEKNIYICGDFLKMENVPNNRVRMLSNLSWKEVNHSVTNLKALFVTRKEFEKWHLCLKWGVKEDHSFVFEIFWWKVVKTKCLLRTTCSYLYEAMTILWTDPSQGTFHLSYYERENWWGSSTQSKFKCAEIICETFPYTVRISFHGSKQK